MATKEKGDEIFWYLFCHLKYKANLKAYSLLYDIKKHKPSLDIKEGTFYNGIPDFSIKVNKDNYSDLPEPKAGA